MPRYEITDTPVEGMANKQFSREMRVAMKTEGAKKIIYWEIPAVAPHACPNCGGVGFMYLFIATKGPFDNSSTKPGEISTWFDDKWWVGQLYPFECPNCHAESYKAPVVEEPEVTQVEFSEWTNK